MEAAVTAGERQSLGRGITENWGRIGQGGAEPLCDTGQWALPSVSGSFALCRGQTLAWDS